VRDNPEATHPEITVLIVAHNEEKSIRACLRAIDEQDYPMERVEVVLVDDRSTDRTIERAEQLDLDYLRMVSQEKPQGNLTTRQSALDLGFAAARGEIVLLANVNGGVPHDWIRELTGHLSYRDGAVAGPVIFAGRRRFIAGLRSVDSLWQYTLFRWGHRNGWSTGLFCGNLAVWREAWVRIGGFASSGFSLNEDVALAQALTRVGYSLRYLTVPVVQHPVRESLLDTLGRVRRRAMISTPALSVIMFSVVLTNWFLFIMAMVFGGIWMFWLAIRYGFGVSLLAASFSQYRTYQALNWIWIYEPFMMILMPLIRLSNIFRPFWNWSGINYRRHGPVGVSCHSSREDPG